MSHSIQIGGAAVPLTLRRSGRARRLSLRVDADGRGVTVVLPPRAAETQGLRFAAAHAGWIAKRLAALPPRVVFAPGAQVPVLGRPHVLCHRPEARRGVWLEDGALCVSGRAEFLARRVATFLRDMARGETSRRARPMAAALDRRLGRVSVRDTRSRWGSCTAAGDLAFSWRLVLAPESVLDYVVAHEVAHLVEMNHSRDFWRLVLSLAPHAAQARRWLKSNGAALHRYG